MSLRKALVSIGALTALLAVAPGARAQGCKTAADCGKGFTCELELATPPPAGKTTPACVTGTACPVVDPTPAPDPTPSTTGTCIEAPCASDADCGPTMVCHTETYGECSGGSACPANAECFAPSTPPTCTTRSVSTCEYKWQLGCKADADCGDGFSCDFAVSTSCSGGSGAADGGVATPVSGSGAGSSSATSRSAPVPPGDGCTTTTDTIGTCTLKATSCAVDADCPAAWTCADLPPRPGVGVGVGEPDLNSTTGAIAPGEPDPSGSTTPPAAPIKACESPLGSFGGYVLDANGAPTETAGGGTGGASGTDKTSAHGGTTPMAAGSSTGAPSAGCAVGGGAPSSALVVSALALLGLAIARRRR
jgi:hypothetical protein